MLNRPPFLLSKRKEGCQQVDGLDISILQEALFCGMVSPDELEIINKMKKEKVLAIHKYKITEPVNNKGRYMTYIQDNEKRVKITATSLQNLINKLYKHYFDDCAMTLEKLYPEWLAKRKSTGVSARTVRRNENHWNKYYSGSPITQKPLHKITSENIEDFFHGIITKYNITSKELGNMKYIFSDMMKLAKKKNHIQINPFNDVDICTNACKPQKKQNDTSRVYLPEEKEKLFVELNKELTEHPDITDMYAIFLLFKLGLRIGEMVALKWADIDYQSCEIHIHRMETRDYDENEKLTDCIVEHTKKRSPYGDRFLPLGDYEINTFQKIKDINKKNNYNDDDFIFCDEKGRTNIRSIDNRIRKLCRHAGIEIKSAHDIRRTVASEMFNNGIPVVAIRNYLGHSDIKTTYGYILDNRGKEERNNTILNSLSSLNGLCTQMYSN